MWATDSSATAGQLTPGHLHREKMIADLSTRAVRGIHFWAPNIEIELEESWVHRSRSARPRHPRLHLESFAVPHPLRDHKMDLVFRT